MISVRKQLIAKYQSRLYRKLDDRVNKKAAHLYDVPEYCLPIINLLEDLEIIDTSIQSKDRAKETSLRSQLWRLTNDTY